MDALRIRDCLDVLGKRVRDVITGAEGIVTSVSFDLSGCTQATINRGFDKDGKAFETHWYDINRLEILRNGRVMPLPDFEFDKGPMDKPSRF